MKDLASRSYLFGYSHVSLGTVPFIAAYVIYNRISVTLFKLSFNLVSYFSLIFGNPFTYLRSYL
jgi:hypothetical protein